jgi:O-antigen ligase
MPPSVAALLTAGFVLFLLAKESRAEPRASAALWIPVLWLSVTGSRFISQWLALGQGGVDNSTEGSPLDAVYFLGLICAATVVLVRRQVSLWDLARKNAWLSLFVLYGLLAVLWSDFPFIATKRWVKTLGHPLVALIILTDNNPTRALCIVMRRCAYLLLPTSILLIKYYPEYGRGFDAWTGQPMNIGVVLNKNGLGWLCMVFGLFFVWRLVDGIKEREAKGRTYELVVTLGFLYMVGWLQYMSNSQTSFVCLLVGAAFILGLAPRMLEPRSVGVVIVIGACAIAGAEALFGFYEDLILLLGRNATLTDRTEVWADALALQPNPLFGAGFESFWLGRRLDMLWEKWWWQPNQAHNGYIETYLNLGYVGLALLMAVLLSTFVKACRSLSTDYSFGTYRLAALFAIILFNYTEAAFKAVHLVWTVFFIIAIDYPRIVAHASAQAAPGRAAVDEADAAETEGAAR